VPQQVPDLSLTFASATAYTSQSTVSWKQNCSNRHATSTRVCI